MAFVDILADEVDVQLGLGGPVDIVSINKYTAQLVDLLPQGAAWTRSWSSTLVRVLRSCSAELSRVGQAVWQVTRREFDPRKTSWLIDEWETFLGLPICLPAPTEIAARRAAAHAKLIGRGFKPFELYNDIAASLGYVIAIFEFYEAVMHADSPCDHKLYGEGWKHTWKVEAASGDNDELLECLLLFYSPSHTKLIVEFI